MLYLAHIVPIFRKVEPAHLLDLEGLNIKFRSSSFPLISIFIVIFKWHAIKNPARKQDFDFQFSKSTYDCDGSFQVIGLPLKLDELYLRPNL